jgi:hypothetical protein
MKLTKKDKEKLWDHFYEVSDHETGLFVPAMLFDVKQEPDLLTEFRWVDFREDLDIDNENNIVYDDIHHRRIILFTDKSLSSYLTYDKYKYLFDFYDKLELIYKDKNLVLIYYEPSYQCSIAFLEEDIMTIIHTDQLNKLIELIDNK